MRSLAVAGLLTASVLALVALSLVVGPGSLEPSTALWIVLDHLLGRPPSAPPLSDALVWDLRLPRALLAAAIGAALGFAGAITQGLFRNPMAEPGVLGVSAGAATLAVLGISLGLDERSAAFIPGLAALGALGVLGLLIVLIRDHDDTTTLLLSGIALAAMSGAVTTLLLAIDTERWDLGIKVVRWLMGSFEGRSWPHLGGALLPLLAGLGLGLWLRLDLDALQLGPETAASLGIDLVTTQRLALLSVALLVGAATALSGVIGFVGLLVPHVVRLVSGPGHAQLLPRSAFIGAIVMLLVDLATRAFHQVAIPPGAVTSLLGAPLLIWLLRRGDGRRP